MDHFYISIYRHASYAAPKPEYTVGIEPVRDENASVEELLIKEKDLPNTVVAFLPLVGPAFLIALASILNMTLPKTSA